MELVKPRDLWHNTVSKLLKLEILQWELGKSFCLSAFFLPSCKYTYRNTHIWIYMICMFLLYHTNVHNIWKLVWVDFYVFFYCFLLVSFFETSKRYLRLELMGETFGYWTSKWKLLKQSCMTGFVCWTVLEWSHWNKP